MPKTMLPSQMAALEEPADALVVNAAHPAHVIVQQILDAIGR
jgi:gluconate kinase